MVRVAVGPSFGRSTDGVLTEEAREGLVGAVDVDDKSTVTDAGVEDMYGEDTATEDQLVTPWSLSVAR